MCYLIDQNCLNANVQILAIFKFPLKIFSSYALRPQIFPQLPCLKCKQKTPSSVFPDFYPFE